MRKLFVAALAICLVFAFTMPVAATDVKFSGEYYVRGDAWNSMDVRANNGTTQQWYFSKFRVAGSIAIEEGVGAYFRGDIFDNYYWGSSTGSQDMQFDYAWGWFNTAFGKFTIGQQAGGTWGTVYGDEWRRADKIFYQKSFGPWGILAVVEKDLEADRETTQADADIDLYYLGATYKWEGGTAGVLGSYSRGAIAATAASTTGSFSATTGLPITTTTAAANGYKIKTYGITPYMSANFGPVSVEAELTKLFGNDKEYEDGLATPDISRTGLSAYAQAKMNFGPAYAGAFFAYMQGDDPTTADENELGATGNDWDLGFILFNDEDWTQGDGTNGITTHGAAVGNEFGLTNNDGAIGYGLIAGFAPTEALDIKAALVTGKADEKQAGYVDDDFGVEFDIEANYKLFSSVTYTVRFGYLWTGDYWKGTSTANQVDDIWMAEHMISWKF